MSLDPVTSLRELLAKELTRTCQKCHKAISKKRANAKFCSTKCRVDFHDARKRYFIQLGKEHEHGR